VPVSVLLCARFAVHSLFTRSIYMAIGEYFLCSIKMSNYPHCHSIQSMHPYQGLKRRSAWPKSWEKKTEANKNTEPNTNPRSKVQSRSHTESSRLCGACFFCSQAIYIQYATATATGFVTWNFRKCVANVNLTYGCGTLCPLCLIWLCDWSARGQLFINGSRLWGKNFPTLRTSQNYALRKVFVISFLMYIFFNNYKGFVTSQKLLIYLWSINFKLSIFIFNFVNISFLCE